MSQRKMCDLCKQDIPVGLSADLWLKESRATEFEKFDICLNCLNKSMLTLKSMHAEKKGVIGKLLRV